MWTEEGSPKGDDVTLSPEEIEMIQQIQIVDRVPDYANFKPVTENMQVGEFAAKIQAGGIGPRLLLFLSCRHYVCLVPYFSALLPLPLFTPLLIFSSLKMFSTHSASCSPGDCVSSRDIIGACFAAPALSGRLFRGFSPPQSTHISIGSSCVHPCCISRHSSRGRPYRRTDDFRQGDPNHLNHI